MRRDCARFVEDEGQDSRAAAAAAAMFNDDFDEFRARSYSGGFLCVAAVDGRRSTRDPTNPCYEPLQAGNDVTVSDDVITSDVGVPETGVLSGRVGGRRHSDEKCENDPARRSS